jgi:hypothetical protein
VLAVLLMHVLISQFRLLLPAVVAFARWPSGLLGAYGIQNYGGVSAATLFRFFCVPYGVFMEVSVFHASGACVKTAASLCFSSSVCAKIQQSMFSSGVGN